MSKYNKDDILQAGVDILTTKGYSGLGIQHVLKVCGIPKGSFYNFFESKDTFIIEALELYNEKVKYLLDQINQDTSLNCLEKVRSFYHHANEYFYNQGHLRTCPMMNIVSDDVDNQLLNQLIHSKIDMHKEYISSWIHQGLRENLIHSDKEASTLTHMIYDNYHGAVLRMKYENSRKPLENFLDRVLPFYLS